MTGYPDFICIGAHKAATTWLYETLRWTPGIFLPAIKELHYFSEHHCPEAKNFGPKHRARRISMIREFHNSKLEKNKHEEMILAQLAHLDTAETNDDWYRGIFNFAKADDICGEICPCYMSMSSRGIRHALSINPLVRILVLVRDPVDRMWSHMRMHSKFGGISLDLDDIMSGKLPMGLYMDYTDYAGSLRRWKSMAGEERLKVIVYDRIRTEPQSVLNEILEYIGVEQSIPKTNLSKVVFSGDEIKLPIELRAKLFEDLEPQYDFLHSIFPEQVDLWVRRHKDAMKCPTTRASV